VPATPEPRSSRTAFHGRYLDVLVEEWPGGEYEFVRRAGAASAGAVAIVPVTAAGDVLLVRQLRQSIRTELLEVPAGLRDVDGETPEECARRELEEETGHRAVDLERLGSAFFTSAGLTDEEILLYRATAEPAPSGAPEHGIDVVHMRLTDAVAAVAAGEIRDAKTALGLLLVASSRPPSSNGAAPAAS
jgi:ADP-ribose pyrophosphatase